MNTQHACLKAPASEHGERQANKRANGSSIYHYMTAIALGFFVVVTLWGPKSASAAVADSTPCPPERIIYLDGIPFCEETITIVDTTPYNLRWNLPDARGGGVPTNNGYIPRARDWRPGQRTRPPHQPTKKTVKTKTNKKVTDKVKTVCGKFQDQNRNTFSPPDKTHPDSYRCEFVKSLGTPPGPCWVYVKWPLNGFAENICVKVQTEADRNSTIKPSPERDKTGWDCTSDLGIGPPP